jgi:hypothetical protein
MEDLGDQIKDLQRRVSALEERKLGYYANRWDALDKLIDYLVGAEIPGDYCEFGVFKGTTFSYMATRGGHFLKDTRFVAFDSFEGLPPLSEVDARDGYSSGFFPGQFAFGLEDFRKSVAEAGAPMDRVVVVPGWFDATLAEGSPATKQLPRVSAAWIDCDLYSSTVPVLNFLATRLSVGSVLLFDDWRCFRNKPDRGQQLACRQWLALNPHITLHEFVDFGFHGVSFTVGSC